MSRLPSPLVLAAGLGTRLDPLTRIVAKAAVPLAGQTLIERALGWLVREGATDVVVNLHHRPETIAAVLGDGTHLGVRVRYSWEPGILGSAGGPRHALPLLDGDAILIVNAEPLVDCAVAPLVAAHEASGADVTLAVVPHPAPDVFSGLAVDDGGVVRAIVPKGRAAGTWHFVGVQIAAARVFAPLPDDTPAETMNGIYGELIAAGRVRAHPVDGPVIHVGTPAEYLDAAIALGRTAASDTVIEPGVRDVSPSARLRRTVVWAGASIGAHVDLVNCIVTSVTLPAGFAARDAVIVPAAVAPRGERVERRGDIALFRLQA
ncbi:MAG TPA: sugar phosphate nucleotidyltransferase [Vicinamibacterales bacterium]|nr:sugar phosphate nucleotidyltransferase [Vicinamibacterales bacterium]